jgi:RNA polymerase sigma-70 factor (ECF subfamily)
MSAPGLPPAANSGVQPIATGRDLGNRDAVDDVCQDVWAAVARGLPAFRGDAPLRAWILAIARHKTFDAWQRSGGWSTLDSQLADGGPLANVFGVHPPTTPSRALSRRRRMAALHAAFERLRPDDRELLELRFMLDLKPAEIVHVLGTPLPANTIAQRIVRATQRLRHQLVGTGVTA